MSSLGVLNYFAFFSLYIIFFVFIYKQFSEIIGFSILIVVNLAFLLFSITDIMSIFEKSLYFVQMIGCFSIITGLVLHSIVLIFILILINNLKSKYTKKYGAPLILPKKYKGKMESIKRLMIASVCLGCIIFYNLAFNAESLKHSLYLIIKYFEVKSVYQYTTLFFTLFASLSLCAISSIQVYDANEFSILTRQQLMDQ